MENEKIISGCQPIKKTAHEVILEWRRKKKEDEQQFDRETEDPEYKKIIADIQGKVVSHGIVPS